MEVTLMMIWSLLLMQSLSVMAPSLVSRGKPAYESSNYSNQSPPKLAVDGNYNQAMVQRTGYICACTNSEMNPWWYVDLLAQYRITNVIIWNRSDCCGDRLSPLKVDGLRATVASDGTASSEWATLCTSITTPITVNGGVYNLSCNASWSASAVKLTQMSTSSAFLTLCEVEVWAFDPGIAKGLMKRLPTSNTSKKTADHIPCFIFDDHDEALQTIYRQIGRKKLPLSGLTLLHYDSHPDMVLPPIPPHVMLTQPKTVIRSVSIEDWIWPMVYGKHVDSVIWMKPPWSLQLEKRPWTEYHLGPLKDDPNVLCITCPDEYFVEEGGYAALSDLEESSAVAFRLAVEGLHTSEHECASCQACQDLVENLLRNPFVLDIDLDTFTCCNPMRDMFTDEQQQWIEELYGLERGNEDLSTFSRKHREKYAQLGVWIKMRTEGQPLPVDDDPRAVVMQKLCDSVEKSKASLASDDQRQLETLEYFHYVWKGGWDQFSPSGVPHQVNDADGIRAYVAAMEHFLRRLGPHRPLLITVSRSHKDGYVPLDMLGTVETELVGALRRVFGEDRLRFFTSYAQAEASGDYVPRQILWTPPDVKEEAGEESKERK